MSERTRTIRQYDLSHSAKLKWLLTKLRVLTNNRIRISDFSIQAITDRASRINNVQLMQFTIYKSPLC